MAPSVQWGTHPWTSKDREMRSGVRLRVTASAFSSYTHARSHAGTHSHTYCTHAGMRTHTYTHTHTHTQTHTHTHTYTRRHAHMHTHTPVNCSFQVLLVLVSRLSELVFVDATAETEEVRHLVLRDGQNLEQQGEVHTAVDTATYIRSG